MVLHRDLLLGRQLHPDLINRYSLLELDALNILEVECASLIIGDVMDDGLFNPETGYFLEIDEYLICHILQLHLFVDLLPRCLRYLLEYFLLYLLQAFILLLPS